MARQYLSMLQRLLALRRRYASELTDDGLDLIDRAICAVYRECIDAGAGAEARALLSTSQIVPTDS